jgi:hypothetical protein
MSLFYERTDTGFIPSTSFEAHRSADTIIAYIVFIIIILSLFIKSKN